MHHPSRWLTLSLLALGVLALLATGTASGRGPIPAKHFSHRSQSVAIRYWVEHPDQAPAGLRAQLRSLSRGAAAAPNPAPDLPHAFNADGDGLPQNEESISACRTNTNLVLGSTNDYRGLLDPDGNFTGWHLSLNSGRTLKNEGLMPAVHLDEADVDVPSGGDPVTVFDLGCNAFGASLAYDPFDPYHNPNGIAVYRSDPATLASCAGGADPSCWPVRRAIAEVPATHFLDKEWIDVGISGSAGEVVWAVFADFTNDDSAPLGYTSAKIHAVRCDAALVDCTEPILISGDDIDTQFADVSIGPDGRVYVTWSEIRGELPDDPEYPVQRFVHKMRVAPAGSTHFGPTREVYNEVNAIPFDGLLNANSFRIATYPKSDVTMIGGEPRVFVVWDACSTLIQLNICEGAQIKLSYSDDSGASWSDPTVISAGGNNYFPAISIDQVQKRIAIAYFTSRFDPVFGNRQDVELDTVNPTTLSVTQRQRITPLSNESEADPYVGGGFIGDYIEVAAHQGTAWVHYNANYRSMQFLGEGLPVPQQDNFLRKVALGN